MKHHCTNPRVQAEIRQRQHALERAERQERKRMGLPPRLGARPIDDEDRQRMRTQEREAMLRRLERDYTYHAPHGDQAERYETLRELGKTLAIAIVTLSPASREQSAALTNLETAIMFANAAIARNESQGG